MINSVKHAANSFWQETRFKMSARNAPVFSWYYKYLYQPKKGSIQEFLDLYSKINQPFTVIQVGANDGITHDLIHKFVKRDQWHGVLLEPQARVFERLNHLYSKDKNIQPVRAALGKETGSTTLYKIGFNNERWATGLASFRKDVVLSAFESGYVGSKMLKTGKALPKNENEWIAEEEIPVISPKDIINKYNLNHIHLLQIDTEGFDDEVVKIFHSQSLLPDAIVLEYVHLGKEREEKCIALLKESGFRTQQFGKDILAVKGDALQVFQQLFKV